MKKNALVYAPLPEMTTINESSQLEYKN